MTVDVDILAEVIGYSLLLGMVLFFAYKSYIYAVIDPLFIFIFTTTFSSVLVVMVLPEIRQIVHFFICQLCVFMGFAIVQRRTGNPALQNQLLETPYYADPLLLRYVVYTLVIVFVISNLVILYTKGFALLSDAPSSTKVTNFQGGFGLFRKINWAVGGVAASGLTFMYLNELRRRDLALLILMMSLTALEGSKGALVRYVVCFGLFLYHPVFRHKRELLQRIKRFAPLAVMGVFGVFFVVLSKENSGVEGVLLAFVRRLLYGGDAMLYFYHPANVDYFSRFSGWDFFTYIINPILGLLRLAPYQEALGNVMVENALPPGIKLDVIVGPNTSFYTEGQIFFGYYGAFLYSFILGAFASYVRSLYFSLVKSSAFLLVLLNTIYQFSAAILIDVKIFVTQCFDTIVFVIPIYFLISFMLRQRIVIRRVRFSTSKKKMPQTI